MLGWLFPRPPVSPYEKAWIEYRSAWLVEKLGAKRLLDAEVILPSDDYFPDVYQFNVETAEAMYRRVCEFLKVDPNEMRFEVLTDDEIPGAAGHYDATDSNQRPALRIAGTQMEDPESLVSTLAHEIAHHILISGGHMTGQEEDHELVTDLLPCLFGLGIFTANSTIRSNQYTSGRSHHWEITRQGYLPAHLLGYVLALFAWLRDEQRPNWHRHLRLDARETMTMGLRYLRRRRDCYIRPETIGRAMSPTIVDIEWQLKHGTASGKIQALWDAAKHPDGMSQVENVQKLLCGGHAAVRAAAIKTAPDFQLRNEVATRDIINGLRDSNYQVRLATVQALERLTPDDHEAIELLGKALADVEQVVAEAAARALLEFGDRAATTVNDILRALRRALSDCDYSFIDILLELLRKTSPDPGQSINDYFTETDGEFRQAAIDALYSQADPEIMMDDPTST